MNKKVSAYCCFIPIGIYAAYSLSMQVLFDVPFMAKSMLLSIIPSAIYLLCFWKLRSSQRGMGLKATFLSNGVLAVLLTFLMVYVGNDTESALIAGIAVHSLIAFILVGAVLRPITYKDNTLLKDEDNGRIYVIRNGIAHVLPDNEAQRLSASDNKIISFSGSQMSIQDAGITPVPLNTSFNDSFSNGITVNPASGMPMVGGISGLDIHGNSWGTNFNEPSNTYDPNRGY
ncbi:MULTISPECIES: hypothetical protein [Enterobacter]|uniref:hypothetical protein n=1 Tax=Enterobacter TaxID=547 RepID=UPI000F81ECB5|nr:MULTISPECIES: hypothetical protein [Enterobacter]MBK2963017.1 hypothetical protein [Klebsiella pneumoniae]MBT1854923.1 hypothetical protein [Enterobacter hormaechei subsp. hoffmannii]HAS0823929.1 hypothetical protein [Enterobacter cloacae subsp. cloacae]HDT4319821.1 hypothetical protein [Klebsiella aerogenes]MBX8838117.1 hypothetical protein [Enterobacter sp. Y17]